jgi:hypothetical protein
MKGNTITSDRAARLAELELIALCKQHQAAKRRAGEVRTPRRMKPDFYSHYLRPVQSPHKRQGPTGKGVVRMSSGKVLSDTDSMCNAVYVSTNESA